MLARIFSRVLLPEPLRPTMPKNSPRSISKEMPSSARSSRKSRPEKGCTARSLSESTRWTGIRKDFFRSSTWIASGTSGSTAAQRRTGAAAQLRGKPRAASARAGGGLGQRAALAQHDHELDLLAGRRLELEGLPEPLPAGEDQAQELGLRPDVHVDRVGVRFEPPCLGELVLLAIARFDQHGSRPLVVVLAP